MMTASYRILLFLLAPCCATAQVVVRDHRIGKEVKWVPKPPRNVVVTSPGTGPIPDNFGQLRVDAQFRDEINFNGNGFGPLAGNNNEVFFSNRLTLNNGSLSSSANEPARKLAFYTDTLTINGNFDIDLTKNNSNENGSLLISARVVKIQKNAKLNIRLASDQQHRYRKFYFFAEQVFVDGLKANDEAKAIKQAVSAPTAYNGHWERLRAGEPQQTSAPKGAGPGWQYRQGYKFVTEFYDPLVATIGFLPAMIETSVDFYNFFSKWVVESYQNLYDKIIRDVNRMDKVPVVRHFMKFLSLNNYNQLETNAQVKSSQWIERINNYKDKIFKNGYQFERKIDVDGESVTLVGSVRDNMIVSYLPPSFALVNSTLINQKNVMGFLVFDETQPNQTALNFDVFLAPDSRRRARISNLFAVSNDVVSPGFEEIQFSNLSITGPDVIANQTKITPLSNSGFNIRLAVNNSSTLLFNRLFSTTASDIFLVGNWSNKAGDITGDVKIPVTFSKQYAGGVTHSNGTLYNGSLAPVIVEYYLDKGKYIPLSPALLIAKDSSWLNAYPGNDKNIVIPQDGISYKLDPERFGDYFEQIDNSDKLTQELFIENHITTTSADSLSGYLQYVEMQVSYKIGDKTFERKFKLSPASSLGSAYSLLIPKSNKEAVAITVAGKAVYENAEYDIIPVVLQNAEAQFDLEEKHLKNKITQ